MAASSTINNFLSFFLRTKPPPPPSPPQFNPTTSQNQKPSSSQPLIAQYNPPPSPSCASSSELSSVICPSMAYSNTLFFRSPYNVQVVVAEDESEEKLLGRFRREVIKAGIVQECRRRRYFENKHEEKKRKSREAARCNRKRILKFSANCDYKCSFKALRWSKRRTPLIEKLGDWYRLIRTLEEPYLNS
ncbi:30S ribosomal protein S21, chloroplastic isoform D [Glycine soja]|uniref:30S ribosomal protein S21, chloroplastic isoform D n=1 Tax=Glycine soja TaxID=3848 RepID=A0A445KKU7_GLYSO|nr:30S ribosomal protein S21, chloroplastic isoform D [Glycine soja]